MKLSAIILIPILLISMGVFVMNSVSTPIESSSMQMDQMVIEMFNAQFTGYAGTQQASAVKALMTAVTSNNAVTPEHIIEVYMNGSKTTPAEIQAVVNTKRKYKVTLDYDYYGYIYEIDVIEL